MQTFEYLIYGLKIASSAPLPGLAAAPHGGCADVRVWANAAAPWLAAHGGSEELWYASPRDGESGDPVLRVWKLAGGAYFRLRYQDGSEFHVDRAGGEIYFTWPGEFELDYAMPYLVGPVIGLTLRLRGFTCLHASAVEIGGAAVAILGPAHFGKSTTAAAFARLGFPVLSDDIVALDERGGSLLVRPGYPRLCLWPESVSALYGSGDALPRITASWDKRYLDLRHNGYRFHDRPAPLAAIYELSARSDTPGAPFLEDAPAARNLLSLIANTYSTYLLDTAMRAHDLDFYSRVLEKVRMRRVTASADPDDLPRLCRLIERDAAS
jgi:hypothetical protein